VDERTDSPLPATTASEVAPTPIDPGFLRHVASSTTSYSEGWREVAARLLWAEEKLMQPARTGCDDCLDARRELLVALKAVTEHMDRAGGDGYGMPECPWCQSQRQDVEEHDADCALMVARAAIAKAEGR
jgi:hypothetical protein